MRAGPLLVGDGIQNVHNAAALLDAARMFTSRAVFRDRGGRLAAAWSDQGRSGALPMVTTDELAASGRVVAVENLPGAADVYGARLPHPERAAVIVGNERRGISVELLALAHQTVQIPMAPGPLDSLNVAAAAAVGLFYLIGPAGRGRMAISAHPARCRPELLLAGPHDHVETGSALRSAACFGWRRVLLNDDQHVWFGVERQQNTEGRAAARRARNSIRVIPLKEPPARPLFDQAVIVTPGAHGAPLHRLNLARGSSQLIIVPDEMPEDLGGVDPIPAWGCLARTAVRAGLGVALDAGACRYRLLASVVMAEVARQVGRPARPRRRPPARPAGRPHYDSLVRLAPTLGEVVDLDELSGY